MTDSWFRRARVARTSKGDDRLFVSAISGIIRACVGVMRRFRLEESRLEIQTFLMTPFAMNCYVIKDGGEALVIDPGEATKELKAAVADSKVTMIFNTHCHIDHSGGNAGMVAATGAPLVCHRDDLPLLRALTQQGMMFGVAV